MFEAYVQLVDLVLLSGFAIDISEDYPAIVVVRHLVSCFEAGLSPYEAAFMFANGVTPNVIVITSY